MATPQKRQYKPPTGTSEDADLYRPGGLHPVHIGDTLKLDRYKILHKLGFGSWSTVWLARDQHKSSYVAIKIVEAADYDPHAIELEVSRRLEKGDHMHRGRQFVTILIDEFVVSGANGTHQCYVTSVAGPRLTRPTNVKYNSLLDARVLASQIFKAIEYLHSCGVVHADLHSDNVLFQLNNFDDWSEKDLYECIGTPIKENIEMIDSTIPIEGAPPAYLVSPCNSSALAERLLLNKVLLIDFGGSFFFDAIPTEIRAPAQYAPPELLYGTSLSPAVDQWTLACLTFELCSGYSLFKMAFNPQNDVIRDMVAMMGKPREEMWALWKDRPRYFHPDGSPLSTADGIETTLYSLEARIRDMNTSLYPDVGVVSDVQENAAGTFATLELRDMYDLLRQIFVYEPELRLSLGKCLEHAFLIVS